MADTYYFKGIAKWAKVQKPAPDYDPTTSSYKLDLYMDDSSFEKFEQSGIQLKVRDSEEGRFVQFRRPEKRMKDGVMTDMTPLIVTDAEGNPVTAMVGNGSEVVCKVSVYNGKKGVGHTLEEVRIFDLIPYDESKTVAPEDIVPF